MIHWIINILGSNAYNDCIIYIIITNKPFFVIHVFTQSDLCVMHRYIFKNWLVKISTPPVLAIKNKGES